MSEYIRKFMINFTWDSTLLKLVIAFAIYTLYTRFNQDMFNQTIASLLGAGIGAWAAYQFTLKQQSRAAYEASGMDIRKLYQTVSKHITQLLQQKKALLAAGYPKSILELEHFATGKTSVQPHIVANEFFYIKMLSPLPLDNYSSKLFEKTTLYEDIDFYNTLLTQALRLSTELHTVYVSNIDKSVPASLMRLNEFEFQKQFSQKNGLPKHDIDTIVINGTNFIQILDNLLNLMYYEILDELNNIPQSELEKMGLKEIRLPVPPEELAYIPKELKLG